ncbi:hypothetical protein BN1013_01028 [Candidatus Rubidus massiliensis]|nr:hypothetical protein BN1013_01028 [Candidatus Rubidus massiliensis]
MDKKNSVQKTQVNPKNFTIERNIDKENPLVQDPKIETAERSKRQKKKLS